MMLPNIDLENFLLVLEYDIVFYAQKKKHILIKFWFF